jgi:hypothetical protein
LLVLFNWIEEELFFTFDDVELHLDGGNAFSTERLLASAISRAMRSSQVTMFLVVGAQRYISKSQTNPCFSHFEQVG